jgi:hypothetical protein
MSEQKQKISWQAAEFKYFEKNTGWYVTATCVAALIIAYFIIFQQDWFAAVTVVIITGIMIYFSTHRPETVLHELNDKGIAIGNFQFPYKQLKYFWVVNDNKHKTVNFETNTLIKREILLELEDQDPEEVEQFLKKYLPEHTHNEPTLAQRASHFFKF